MLKLLIGDKRKPTDELTPVSTDQDVSITKTFSLNNSLEVTAIDVQHGATQRSYLRFVDITFNRPDVVLLQQLIADGRIKLERFSIQTDTPTPGSGTLVDLSNVDFSIAGKKLELDFGLEGIGGDRNSNLGDGFYQLSFDLDSDDDFSDARLGFFRMFGDANGDGKVDSTDVSSLMSEYGRRGINLEGDINGDGVVNILDRVYTTREARLGKALNSNLYNYIDD